MEKMPSEEDDSFCKKMRKSTRDVHAVSDALVNAKLAFGLTDNLVWADGLLVFYEVFRYLEGAMVRLKTTKVGQFMIPALLRTEAFEEDLEYYLGKDWMKTYTPRDSVVKYLMRLREVEDTDPTLLIAYIYHLYMGLLSGGMILRKKRQLAQKICPFKEQTIAGNRVTDFGDNKIYQLKQDLRQTMNKVANSLDEDSKNKLIEESKIVYALNNEVIRSIRGAGTIIVKRLFYFFSITTFAVLIFLLFYTQ